MEAGQVQHVVDMTLGDGELSWGSGGVGEDSPQRVGDGAAAAQSRGPGGFRGGLGGQAAAVAAGEGTARSAHPSHASQDGPGGAMDWGPFSEAGGGVPHTRYTHAVTEEFPVEEMEEDLLVEGPAAAEPGRPGPAAAAGTAAGAAGAAGPSGGDGSPGGAAQLGGPQHRQQQQQQEEEEELQGAEGSDGHSPSEGEASGGAGGGSGGSGKEGPLSPASLGGGAEAASGGKEGGGGRGPVPALSEEEVERRKRKREAWEAEQAGKRRWDLHRRLADISADLEVLTREVARMKRDMGDQPPLTRQAEQDRAAIEANRSRRLAEIVRTSCKKCVLHITAHKWCWPFNQPVDTNIYKDYLDMVRTPMDFSTVKKKIEQGQYRTPDEFLEDVLIIFHNARTYNKPGSDVYVMANTIQEKFEDKYSTLVAPRVSDVLTWSRAEEEEARRRHAGASVGGRGREEWDAMEQRCEVLLKYIDEVAACIADAKSAAAALCQPVGREDKARLCRALASLPQDYFEMALALVLKDHPGLQPTDDIQLDIDALDALTLRQLQSFVNACERALAGSGGAKGGGGGGGGGGGRLSWPGLVMGAGIKALPKKPRALPQQAQQAQQAGSHGDAQPLVKQEASPGGATASGGAAGSPAAAGEEALAAAASPRVPRGQQSAGRSPSPFHSAQQAQQAQQAGGRPHGMTLRGTPPPPAASPTPATARPLAALLQQQPQQQPGGRGGRHGTPPGGHPGLTKAQQDAVARQASIASNSGMLPTTSSLFPLPLSREGSVAGPAALPPFFLQIPQNPAAASAMALALQMMQQQQHQQHFLQQHQQQLAAAAAAVAQAAAAGRPPPGAAAAKPQASAPAGAGAGGAKPGSAAPAGAHKTPAALPMPAAALDGLAAQLRLPPTIAAQMLAAAAAGAGAAPGLGGLPTLAAGAMTQQAQQAQLQAMHQLLTRVGAAGAPSLPALLLQQQQQAAAAAAAAVAQQQQQQQQQQPQVRPTAALHGSPSQGPAAAAPPLPQQPAGAASKPSPEQSPQQQQAQQAQQAAAPPAAAAAPAGAEEGGAKAATGEAGERPSASEGQDGGAEK